MAKIHIKGYLLRTLHQNPEGLWDHQIAGAAMEEYQLCGGYWKGLVRVTLADLYSSGLVEHAGEALDDGTHFARGRILFKYRLTDFGRRRMTDTGLL